MITRSALSSHSVDSGSAEIRSLAGISLYQLGTSKYRYDQMTQAFDRLASAFFPIYQRDYKRNAPFRLFDCLDGLNSRSAGSDNVLNNYY